MSLNHEQLTERIIGAAIDVHRRLGPGFLESIYENAMVIELTKRGIQVQRQQEIVVTYDDIEVGRHRLDLMVEDLIVVELKTVRNIDDIFIIVNKSYLRAADKKDGLILNFSKAKLEIKRVFSNTLA